MKYKVYNKTTQEYEGENCIVTQEGKVAFWDKSQGWWVDPDQEKYAIEETGV